MTRHLLQAGVVASFVLLAWKAGLAPAVALAASLACLIAAEWLQHQKGKADALEGRLDVLEKATKVHVQELERRVKEVSDRVVGRENAKTFGQALGGR